MVGLIQYLTPLCAPNGGLKPGLCKTLPSSGRALGTTSRGVHACVSTGEFLIFFNYRACVYCEGVREELSCWDQGEGGKGCGA